jgi:hypothetical protein
LFYGPRKTTRKKEKRTEGKERPTGLKGRKGEGRSEEFSF